MHMLILKHEVNDYVQWRPGFDAHDAARREHGLTVQTVGRGVDNPNVVVVVCQVADKNKAKAFLSAPGLKEAMAKSGVKGTPEITMFETA